MKVIKRSDAYNWFIIALTLINTYYCIQPHFTDGVMDIDHVFMGIFIGVFFVLFVLTSKISMVTLFSLLVLFVSGVFVFFRAPTFVLEYFIKWIEFVISILLYTILITSSHKLKKSTWNMIFLTSLIIMFVYLIEAFDAQYYTYSNDGDKLILTCVNQNSAAMQLLLVGSLFFLFAKKYQEEKKNALTVLCFCIILLTLYLIYLTGSRSSLIAIIFLACFFFIPKMEKLVTKPVIIAVLLFPLIFALVLVELSNYYDEIILLDKNLFNGRELMWRAVFNQPLSNKLLGSYHVYTILGQPPFQLHNGVVDMIATYGIIITAIFLFAVYKLLIYVKNKNTAISTLLVVCILALMVQSTGEAALFLGGRCSYVALLFTFINSPINHRSERKGMVKKY